MIKSITFSISSRTGFLFLILGMGITLILAIKHDLRIVVILVALSAIDTILSYKDSAIPRFLRKKVRRIRRGRVNEWFLEMEDEHDLMWAKSHSEDAMLPPMNKDQALISGGAYAVLGFGLYAFMSLMQHLPGADVAMEILKG